MVTMDLRLLGFAPLSEAKATLSEKVRQVRDTGQPLVITTNGRPSAVLLSYEDYLGLFEPSNGAGPSQEIDLERWERERAARRKVRDTVLERFDVGSLSRKGQKRYKREKVRDLSR